jgi:hypothetical protein
VVEEFDDLDFSALTAHDGPKLEANASREPCSMAER